jgi:GH24 family phage-related lysozyme (muramidase)
MARLPVDIADLSNRNELPSGAMNVQQATARSAGGQVGAAVAGLGDAVQGLALKIEANKRQSSGFDIEQQFLALQEEEAREYQERQRGLAGSGDGHWEATREATATKYNEWVDSLPSWAQDEYRTKAASKIAQRSNAAFQDQYVQQDNNTRAVLSDEERKAGVAVQENPETFEEFRARQHGLIDKSTLPAAEKETRKREIDAALAVTAAESDAVNNPGRALGATMQPGVEGIKGLIRKKEGFRETAYWDVTAWRTGYGSDTYTTADGKVHKVTQDSVITREDAERDLDRRINTEFMPAAVDATGADAWAKLSPAAQAVMTSLSYNYGAGAWTGRLKGVADAAKTGDPQALAEAVRGLAGDNGGVNAGRRNSEADMVLSGTGQGGAPPAYLEYLNADQRAAYERTAQNAFQGQMQDAQAIADAQRKAAQDAALLSILEGPDPDGAYAAARQEGLFGTYDEVKKLDTALKGRQENDTSTQRGLDIMSGAVLADRMSEGDRKAVNMAFNSSVRAGVEPEVAARAAFDKTGIVPPDFAKGLMAGAASRDPAKVEAALVGAANLLGADPNAFNGVTNSGRLVDDAFEFQRRTQILGESSADAAAAILADRLKPPASAAALTEGLKTFRKDVLTPEAVEAGLAAAAENGWGRDAAVPVGAMTGGDAMRSIYRGLAEEGFRKFGDPDRAISYAATEVGRRFGIFNDTLIQYPPDKAGLPALPNSDEPYAWVAEQAATEATAALGVDVPPGQVVLVPVEERGVSTRAAFTGTPMSIPGKQGKASVPYSIVVVPDDGGAPMVVPGVFLPDIEDYVKTKNAAPVATDPGVMGYGAGVEVPTDPLMTPAEAEAAAAAEAQASQDMMRDFQTREEADLEQLMNPFPQPGG